MAKPRRGGGRPPRARGKRPEDAVRKDDVYEAEDAEADEERHAERYDVSYGCREMYQGPEHALRMCRAPRMRTHVVGCRRRCQAAAYRLLPVEWCLV